MPIYSITLKNRVDISNSREKAAVLLLSWKSCSLPADAANMKPSAKFEYWVCVG